MPRTYEGTVEPDEAPPIDVPDWELIERVSALLVEHAPPDSAVGYQGQDNRGAYSETDLDSFRHEVEQQDDPPHSIWISLHAMEGGTPLHYMVSMVQPGFIHGHTFASFESSNEPVVAHLANRTRDLLARAGERRKLRLRARLAPGQTAPAVIVGNASAWERWTVPFIIAVAAAIVGGLILALVLGAFS
jgi:hypothetical protein